MTTPNDIGTWFDEGKRGGATHLIVVFDSWDHEDYPVYVKPTEDVREIYNKHQGQNMERVMEVYNLSMDKAVQLAEFRAFNF